MYAFLLVLMALVQISVSSDSQDINKNEDETVCVIEESSNKANSYSYFVFLFIGIELILTLVYVIFSKGSINGLFLMVTFGQNLIFLLLLETSFPSDIISFLNEIGYLLFNFSFLSRGAFEISYPSCNQYERQLHTCTTTKLMGLESRSTWNNITYQFFLFAILLVFQSVISVLYLRAVKQKKIVNIFLIIL